MFASKIFSFWPHNGCVCCLDGNTMALSSGVLSLPEGSRVTHFDICTVLRPRWSLACSLFFHSQGCCLPAIANRRFSQVASSPGASTTIFFLRLYRAACMLAPSSSILPLPWARIATGFARGFHYRPDS